MTLFVWKSGPVKFLTRGGFLPLSFEMRRGVVRLEGKGRDGRWTAFLCLKTLTSLAEDDGKATALFAARHYTALYFCDKLWRFLLSGGGEAGDGGYARGSYLAARIVRNFQSNEMRKEKCQT